MSSEIKELRVTHFDNGKKIMYLAKEFLLSSEVIYISGTTNSAGTAARAAEGLVRFGYVTIENVKTETIIENGRKRTRFVVTIKKTKDFDKLYKENEEKRKQKEEERKKEGVLKINCGVPIVFVINKADVVTQSSEKKKI